MWNEVVSSRSDYDSLPTELKTSPRNGAVDGFPIKVYTNGTYQGIYTWNIGKDAWMWNMDEDNESHMLLCAEVNDSIDNPCNFNKLVSSVDDGYWSVEVGTKSNEATNGLNNIITCVMNTDDETFKATIGNYLDIQSAIDYYIHQYVICGLDGLAKNMLLGTYDLVKWYCGAYDMDSTFGLYWNGSSFVSTEYACPEDYQAKNSLLWQRIEKMFKEELKTRYFELRKTVYSFSNMVAKFERFMDIIGLELYDEDLTIYSNIPTKTTNNIQQIRNYIRDRLTYVDNEIRYLGETKYSITNNLTNATSSNSATVILEGTSYSANITPSTGCEINSVSITMGGDDITSTVYKEGVINIENVTGDIVITVIAQSGVSGDSLIYTLPQTTTLDGTSYVDTGVTISETDKDWSIVMDVENGTHTDMAWLFSDVAGNFVNGNCGIYQEKGGYATVRYMKWTPQNSFNENLDGKKLKAVICHETNSGNVQVHFATNGAIKTSFNSPMTGSNGFIANTNTLVIGGCRTADSVANNWIGTLNKFDIYERVLTSEEITTLLS